MVVIDEAYFEFSGVTVIPWIRRHDNLIVTRTFSKTAGLAGLRLGCIFVNRELATSMRKSQSPYPVNCAALVAAEAAMRDRAFIARTVREVKAGREQLEKDSPASVSAISQVAATSSWSISATAQKKSSPRWTAKASCFATAPATSPAKATSASPPARRRKRAASRELEAIL